MKVYTGYVELESKGQDDMVDVTDRVAAQVAESDVKNGIATVFVGGSTGVVSTVEYEPGLLKDVPRALSILAPYGQDYEHHKTWGDDNGSAHVRATLMGPSITIPIVAGKLTVGTWQQIVFIECDTRPRKRKLVIQILGE